MPGEWVRLHQPGEPPRKLSWSTIERELYRRQAKERKGLEQAREAIEEWQEEADRDRQTEETQGIKENKDKDND